MDIQMWHTSVQCWCFIQVQNAQDGCKLSSVEAASGTYLQFRASTSVDLKVSICVRPAY